ncbi:MAG: transketolase family protein [Candidatus Limnocylindrales bacterium]
MSPDPSVLGRSQRETFGRTISELADEDPNILVLDGDLANSTKADIVAGAHPDRFLQMGIAEQNMVGVAAGLATQGFIPIVSTFACFAVYRALDQVRVLVAQPHLNVKLVGAYSGLTTGFTGKTHQAIDDLSVMRSIPGMVVIAPADEAETRTALRAAVAYVGPVYVRLTRDPGPLIFDRADAFEIGRARWLRQGADVTIFSTGQQTTRVLQAADLLERRGIEAAVVHVPTLKPLDAELIRRAARATGRIVSAEEHAIIGGLGAAVAEAVGESGGVPQLRLGIQDRWGESASNDDLLERHGLSVARLVESIGAFVAKTQGARA